MLNEDKIKLMTKIAMFEKHEGKKIFPVTRYFKGDYISSHLIRAFISYTFCSLLFIVIWGLYNLQGILDSSNPDALIQAGIAMAVLYVLGLILYLCLTFFVYLKRYKLASRGLKAYMTILKRLEKRYEFQNKTRELAKEGRQHDESTRI